jgi:uncharacterized protein involved in outer membrane biogenesis
MRRFLLLLSICAALLALLLGAGWVLLHNEPFLKSRLNAFMVGATGRALTVGQALRLQLGRRLVVYAEDVRLENADWADPPSMAQAGRLRLVLDLPSLFEDTVIIHELEIEDCAVHLAETEGGAANWDDLMALGGDGADDHGSEPGRPLPVVFRDNRMRNCRLQHDSPSRTDPLTLGIDELDLELLDDIRWQIQGGGSLNGEPLTVSGWLEPAGVFISGGTLRHDLSVKAGGITLDSEGTLQDVHTGQGADLNLRFQGPEIADVLAFLDLPAASTGAFDFRLRLDSRGEMTNLDLDGDLGSLKARLQGELDQLAPPTRGRIRGEVQGPDLALLGSILGVEGLAAAPYTLEADLDFEPGSMRFGYLGLRLPDDQLSVAGVLGRDATRAGTDLDLTVSSGDLGRWAAAFGQPVRQIGAVVLTSRLIVDEQGQSTLRVRGEYSGNTVTLVGGLGSLAGPVQPALKVELYADDLSSLEPLLGNVSLPKAPMSLRGHIEKPRELVLLDKVNVLLGGHTLQLSAQVNPKPPHTGSAAQVQISSANAADLGRLFGREGLPVTPFTLSGRITRPDRRLHLEDVLLELDGHRVGLAGQLDPDTGWSGSEFELDLDTPDVAALAQLFGQAGLPREPLSLAGSVKLEGRGLRFQARQSAPGEIRLEVDGRIEDLEQPLGIDARFDIRLPSLRLLQFLVESRELPDLPFTAQGVLQNDQERVYLEDVHWTLGSTAVTVDGAWYADQRFALTVDVSGQDASELDSWFGSSLTPEPFALHTRVTGDMNVTEFTEVTAEYGASRANGELKVALGEPTRISGRVDAPYLDLTRFNTGTDKKVEPDPKAPASAFVFDDTPVMRIDDYGVDLELDLSAARVDLGNTVLRDLQLGVRLEKNRLELAPFAVTGKESGTLRGHMYLDQRGAEPVLNAELSGKDLRLGFAAGPDQDIATYPMSEIELLLHGIGVTRREMASSLNGKLRAYLGPGQVTSAGVDLLFSDFLTELFDALNPLAETSGYTKLDCAVFAADIAGGQVRLEPVIVHTEQFTVFSGGTVDLRSEKIDLSFNTKPRKGLGITPSTVINPLIKVGGRLAQPAIELDPARAAISSGAAVATAGLTVFARGFADRWLASKDPCGDARKEIEKTIQ